MSRKKGEKKLGRNPFNEPPRAKKEKGEVPIPEAPETPIENIVAESLERREVKLPDLPVPEQIINELVPKVGEKIRELPQMSEADEPKPFPVEGPRIQVNPAWFVVDIWASLITEPYFFWAKSVEIMQNMLQPVPRRPEPSLR